MLKFSYYLGIFGLDQGLVKIAKTEKVNRTRPEAHTGHPRSKASPCPSAQLAFFLSIIPKIPPVLLR